MSEPRIELREALDRIAARTDDEEVMHWVAKARAAVIRAELAAAELDALRALAETATPGPWTAEKYGARWGSDYGEPAEGDIWAGKWAVTWGGSEGLSGSVPKFTDAEFMVAAVEYVRALLRDTA